MFRVLAGAQDVRQQEAGGRPGGQVVVTEPERSVHELDGGFRGRRALGIVEAVAGDVLDEPV